MQIREIMESENSLENKSLALRPDEVRVLGALIEKSKTTPDYYPLTINSLVTACNQKSARNPVVNYDADTVVKALDSLKKKQLTATVMGDGRSVKYRHTIAVKYPLDPAEVTVLGLLFLRGNLTVGEIKSTAGRMYDFEDLAEVQRVLEQLSDHEPPLVTQLPRRTGQKESRYAYLFAPIVEEESNVLEEQNSATNTNNHEERIQRLEEELELLKEKLKDLL